MKGKLIKKFMYRLEGYINFIGQVRGRNERVYMRLNSDFQKEIQISKKFCCCRIKI